MDFNNRPEVKKIRHYFNFIMVGVYIILGVIFLFTQIGNDTFPFYRKEAGIVFIAYALFRFYTTLKQLKQLQ